MAELKDEEIRERVDSVLSDLGLFEAKDLRVGSPLDKIISGGQRKRLNIALELIREPGVLFLDEAPEFPRNAMESLRQPLESGVLRLSRSTWSGALPADFQLVQERC